MAAKVRFTCLEIAETRPIRVLMARIGILLGLVITPALPTHGALEGPTELLELTALAHRDNSESILSWQGKAYIENLIEDEAGAVQLTKNTASFVYDRVLDAKRWNWQLDEFHRRQNGALQSTPQFRQFRSAMRKSDAFYRYSPGLKKGDEVENTLVIWPPESQKAHGMSLDFDPTWYLTQVGYDIEERLRFACETADDPELTPGMVKREGDLVIWELKGEISLNHFEFDLSKGGNLVLYEGRSEDVTELARWTYEQQEGIWLPKTFVYDNRQQIDPEKVKRTFRKVRFDEQRVNEPLGPSEFTLQKMGVKPGTIVSDRILETRYKYSQEGEIDWKKERLFPVTPSSSDNLVAMGTEPNQPGLRVSVDKSGPRATGNEKGRSGIAAYVLSGFALLLIIVMVTLALRRRSAGPE